MLQTKLAKGALVPKKKFNVPQTSAQELGWDMDTHFEHHSPRHGAQKQNSHGIKVCDEVNYMSDYVTFQKVNPFARKAPGDKK